MNLSPQIKKLRPLLILLIPFLVVLWQCSGSVTPKKPANSWVLRIDRIVPPNSFAFQGAYCTVPIYVDSVADCIVKNIDIQIQYPYEPLTFIEAVPGRDLKDWDYFSYETEQYFPDGEEYSVALIHISASRDIGRFEDAAPIAAGSELFSLEFWVTDDRHFECWYLPLYFYWNDCRDNSMEYGYYNARAVSSHIYNYSWTDQDNNYPEIIPPDGTIDENDHFYGACDECLTAESDSDNDVYRCIRFYTGGIDISCAEPIDLVRGDVNQNQLPNELADVALFAQYFIYGESIFTIDLAKQIRATDVNHDQRCLTLADLTYMIRVITGEAGPINYLSHFADTAVISIEDNYLYIDCDIDLGAAAFTFNGYSPLTSLPQDMTLSFDTVNGEMKILLYNTGNAKIESGSARILHLSEGAELKSCEVAGYDGSIVVSRIIR